MDLTVTHHGSEGSFKGLRRKRESSSEKDEEKDADDHDGSILNVPHVHKSDDAENDDEDHDLHIIGVNKTKFPSKVAVSFPEDGAFLVNDTKLIKSNSSSGKRKKNFIEYYQNAKQRFETFKKSGGSIALQCKRLREKTNCKIYYKAEYISGSGRRMCHWYGSDFSGKDNKAGTTATELPVALSLLSVPVPVPVPGSRSGLPASAPAQSQLMQLPPCKSPIPTAPSSTLSGPLPPPSKLPLPLLSPAPKLIQSHLSPSKFPPLPIMTASKQSYLVLPSPPSQKYPNPSSIETCSHCKRQDVIGPDLKIIETGWTVCRGGNGPCSSRVHNDCLGFPGTKQLPDYYCASHMIYGRRNKRVHSYYP